MEILCWIILLSLPDHAQRQVSFSRDLLFK
uniref:Uncharacterized protein n=1 Tax=Anguilla anguilla TaxID=7936 RepID=A0A0E9RRB0_ANGAN